MDVKQICGRSIESFLQDLGKFHGSAAPGVVLGAFIVDWAQELIGTDVEADVIVETSHCLPDAVQLLTPCTIGNGWMKVLDWDKYALTLYDRKSLFGHRVWLDLKKAKSFPNLYMWYMRLVSKKDLPSEILLETIVGAGRSVLSHCGINLTRFYERKKKGEVRVCPVCGEAYNSGQGPYCIACQGDGYYELIPSNVNLRGFFRDLLVGGKRQSWLQRRDK